MSIAVIVITFVAAIHIAILAVEMFGWRTIGPRLFKSFSDQLFAATEPMAANQGLYNGFLAAGLLWATFVRPDNAVAFFFLTCVFVAGVYGAMTVSKKIFYIQSVPAALGIIALQIWPLTA